MWFIFPQLRALGSSSMAGKFGISSRDEALADLDHPILGPRLRECTTLVNQIEGKSVDQVFEYPDNLKFRSSMTLFASVHLDNRIFKDALDKCFAGEHDSRTLQMLQQSAG